jgi:four helix bundle protein
MVNTQQFENLECYKEALHLTRLIYKLTEKETFSRDVTLVGNVKQSVLSSMANMAEAHHRNDSDQFLQFMVNALAAVAEAMSHSYVALDQGYISETEMNNLKKQADNVWKKVNTFISTSWAGDR